MTYCEGTGVVNAEVPLVDYSGGNAVTGFGLVYRIPVSSDGTCPVNTVLVDTARTVFDQTIAMQYFGFFFGTVIIFYAVGVMVGAVLHPLKNAAKRH